MTGTTRSARWTAVRLMGAALVVAGLAGAPSIATAAENRPQMVVGTFESTFVASVSWDGCALSRTSRSCKTTMRALSGNVAGMPCTASEVFVNGTQGSGVCALDYGAGRAASATATISNTECGEFTVSNLRNSRMLLTDATGTMWRVTEVRLNAGQYVHEGVDNWTLRTVAGVNTTEGSYVKAVNGTRTLFAWVNGTMAAVSYCHADVGPSSFTLAGVAQGWIIE